MLFDEFVLDGGAVIHQCERLCRSVLNTPTLVYIQNETISGTRYISADYIYVGRDVTDRKEYGDVILGPGNITLDAGYVEIKNSTTVPLGTTLTIEN